MTILQFYSSWLLYNILILTLFFLYVYKKENSRLLCMFFLLFTFLGSYGYITADYFSYLEFVEDASVSRFDIFTHIESVYIWLAKFCNGNYYYFRFTIMSLMFFTIHIILRKIKQNKLSVLFFYSIFSLHINISGRQGLSNAILMLGALLIVMNRKSFFRFSWGIILIIISFFLHKSSLLFLPLLLISLFPLKKKYIVILFLLVPVFIFIENQLLDFVISFSSEAEVVGRSYLISENRYDDRNIWWWLLAKIQDISVFAILLFEILLLLKNGVLENIDLKYMYKFLFWIFYAAILLYFLNIDSDVIFRRVLAFAKMVMVFLLPTLLLYNRGVKHWVLMLAFIYLLSTNIFILGVSHTNLK